MMTEVISRLAKIAVASALRMLAEIIEEGGSREPRL